MTHIHNTADKACCLFKIAESLDIDFQSVSFQKGSLLFNQGDPVAGLYIIQKGTVQLARITRDGVRQLLMPFIHRGKVFGYSQSVPEKRGGFGA